MIKFEKVSYEQFKKDMLNLPLTKMLNDDAIAKIYDNITLPTRSSKGSAGYDFYSTINIFVSKEDDDTLVIPTGIRAQMPENVVLMIYPRSSLGFKSGVRLANTVGIIDSDYYYSDNEGHIMLKLSKGFKHKQIDKGDRIAQGVFVNYLTTDDDNTETTRNGGIGSSGK